MGGVTTDEPYDWADDPDLGRDEILARFNQLEPVAVLTNTSGGTATVLDVDVTTSTRPATA